LKISIENALGADDFGIRRPRETLLFPSAMMRFAAKCSHLVLAVNAGLRQWALGNEPLRI
jgi:hypothetical protein